MPSKELNRYLSFVIERLKEKVWASLQQWIYFVNFKVWIIAVKLALHDALWLLLLWIVRGSVPASRQRGGPAEDAFLCSSSCGLGDDGTEDVDQSVQVTGGDAEWCSHRLSQRDALFWWFVSMFAKSHDYIDSNRLIFSAVCSFTSSAN